MFSIPICRYSIEILKAVEKCKIIKIKAPREVWGLGINKKIGGWPGFAQF